jgi:hypothetical protein
MSTPASIPPAALWLGLAGLIPFYAAALATAASDPAIARLALASFAIYAAVILSFLGGARWGLELARAGDAPSLRRLAFSVAPSIAGWALAIAAMAYPSAPGLAGGFAALFAVQYVWDAAAGREGLAPTWYPNLRQILTSGVVLACVILPFARILGRG